MKRKTMIVAGFALCAWLSQGETVFAAAGNEGPHGGDDIGLEFRITAQKVLDDIRKNHPEIHSSIAAIQPDQALDEVSILTVDTPLKVSLRGKIQDSVAVNDSEARTILVNRSRWQSLDDPRLKLGIALHEILSLSGLEQTGAYPISARYVAQLGLSGSALAPTPDRNHTYMSCMDSKSALYLITMSPNRVLTAEVRGLEAGTLANIRDMARKSQIPNADQVVGLSVSVNTEFYLGSTRPYNNCRFDQYNRFVLACDADSKWFYYPNLPRETRFTYADGSGFTAPVGMTSLTHTNTLLTTVHGTEDRLTAALALDQGQLNLSFDSATCK